MHKKNQLKLSVLKLLITVLLLFSLNETRANGKNDTVNHINPFIRAEFGIGASNNIYSPKMKYQPKFGLSYSFCVITGIHIKDFYLGTGVGILTLGYKIKDILLINPYDPIYGYPDKANAHYENLYINIPLLFTYKKQGEKKIFPILEFGINNLINIGLIYGFSGTDFPGYPKLDFIKNKITKARKYVPSLTASIGFGIKLRKGFSYELCASYNQNILSTYNVKLANYSKDYPYSIGIKTGFTYNFTNKK